MRRAGFTPMVRTVLTPPKKIGRDIQAPFPLQPKAALTRVEDGTSGTNEAGHQRKDVDG